MQNLFLTLLCISFVFAGINVKANVLTVSNKSDSGSGSLRDAVLLAISGDTIRFSNSLISNGSDSIVLLNEIVTNKSLTIIGLYNQSDSLFISGGSQNRIFSFSNLDSIVLDSLILQQGYSANHGGAIFCQNVGVQLKIRNCIFRNNIALAHGGAICSLEISNADTVSLQTTISNTDFLHNNGNFGGAFYSYAYSQWPSTYANSSVEIYNSNFIQNTSTGYGGAAISWAKTNSPLAFSESKIKLKGCRVELNYSHNNGGGIFSYSNSNILNTLNTSHVIIDSTQIIGNSGFGGGGVFSHGENSVVEVIDSDISNNEARSTNLGSGGGIYSNSPDSLSFVKVIKSNICNNVANANQIGGGGIFSRSWNGKSQVVIDSCNINNNIGRHGAGVFSWAITKSNLSVSNSKLDGNVSNWFGGALSSLCDDNLLSESDVEIVNCEISNNSAVQGAGIYTKCKSFSSVYVFGSTFFNNSSSSNGGALFVRPSSGNSFSAFIDIINSTITNNSSLNNGGGIFAYTTSLSSHLNIVNSSIINNSSVDGGAGIFGYNYHVSSKGSIIFNPDNGRKNIKITGNSTFSSLGYNAFNDSLNSFVYHSSDFLNIDSANLLLDTLKLNGGSIPTRIPKHGSILNESGDLNDTTQAQNGHIIGIRERGAAEKCDYRLLLKDSICSGSSYLFSDGTIDSNIVRDSVYTSSFKNKYGCDSLIITHLKVWETMVSDSNYFLCEGDTITLNGVNYTEDATIIDTLIGASSNGCDSVSIKNIILKTVSPELNLGNDTIVCILDSINLFPNTNYDSYLWSTGDTLQNITLYGYKEGLGLKEYSLQVFQQSSACFTSDSILISFDNCSGTQDLKGAFGLKIYPNPVSETIHLEYPDQHKYEIHIRDVMGKLFFSFDPKYQKAQVLEIDITSLSEGVYFISVGDKSSISTKAFVIQR